jgi:hypothetical protein
MAVFKFIYLIFDTVFVSEYLNRIFIMSNNILFDMTDIFVFESKCNHKYKNKYNISSVFIPAVQRRGGMPSRQLRRAQWHSCNTAESHVESYNAVIITKEKMICYQATFSLFRPPSVHHSFKPPPMHLPNPSMIQTSSIIHQESSIASVGLFPKGQPTT